MSLRRVFVFALLLFVATSGFAALDLPSGINAEATGPGGAVVTWSASVVGSSEDDGGRPAHTVTCSPASLSTFPLGTTLVSCTGSEGSTGSFNVTVVDTTAPRLTLPRDFGVVTTAPSVVVTYSATANDLVSGSVAVVCTPPSGSTFAVGTTTVTCSASDTHGNTATDTFNIIVSPTPVNPENITAEATSPSGAIVNFDDSVGDDGDGRSGPGTCTPANGSVFPFGTTTVTCPNGTFTVTVVDTTGPRLQLPDSVSAVATSASGINVSFTATATDLVDGSVAVNCTPASGSLFAIGTTNVSCTATDSRSNSTTDSFPVVVTTNLPNITTEATGPGGAVVTFDGTCTPSSGSTFPIGTTTVNCTLGVFLVIVVDTTPPAITAPDLLTVEATSAAGAPVTFTATATDIVDGSVAVVCTPPSGSTFGFGESTATCTATDSRGNSSTATIGIEVFDTTAPVIASITATPNTIWPPNGNLVDVVLSVNVIEVVDPAPIVRIFDVTANEPITAADWSITGTLTVKLRADRDSHGPGRIYTLYVEAIDATGNRSTSTVTVTVPHDQNSSPVTATPTPSKRRSAGRG